MKKIISIVLTLIMAFSCFAIVGSAEKVIYGDMNNDGVVTIEDARLALRVAIGLDNPEKRSASWYARDIITVEDARNILRIALGLENSNIKGDFDSDNYVDAKDVVILRQYLENNSVNINKNADMNDDGIINEDDLFEIRDYLANYVFD